MLELLQLLFVFCQNESPSPYAEKGRLMRFLSQAALQRFSLCSFWSYFHKRRRFIYTLCRIMPLSLPVAFCFHPAVVTAILDILPRCGKDSAAVLTDTFAPSFFRCLSAVKLCPAVRTAEKRIGMFGFKGFSAALAGKRILPALKQREESGQPMTMEERRFLAKMKDNGIDKAGGNSYNK